MEQKIITVLIADDTDIALDGLKAMLETAKDIQVVGKTKSAYNISRLIQELLPDLVIMDLKYGTDETIGWIKIREIKEKKIDVKIIALTAYEHLIPDARKAGADEVITKHFHREELIGLIREVVFNKVARKPEYAYNEPKLETLTHREIDVLFLLEKGLSDKEISQALNIQTNTTKNHVKSILQKLGVKNCHKAVIRARELEYLK